LNRLPAHEGIVCSLAFSPDGAVLASGSDDGTAILWDIRSRKPRHELADHYRAAASLAFSPDGKNLATGAGSPPYQYDFHGARVRIWNVETGRLERQFVAHLTGVKRLAYSPDGRKLVSGGFDSRIRVWDPATGKRFYQIRGTAEIAAFSPDGENLLVWSGPGLTLWSARSV